MWLWALRTGLSPLVPLFCDTRWESRITYDYLDYLQSVLGPIRRVDSEGFEERTRRSGTFPSRARKWCSPELKVQMCAEEIGRLREESDDDIEVLVGFRRDESPKRGDATLTPEREWSAEYDCEVWRPILEWTIADVIAEHHRAHVSLNPLYLAGAERVGCWPCIHACKAELRLIGEMDPERIDKIADIEAAIGQTMFVLEKPCRNGEDREKIPTPIRDVIVWARTSHGGTKLALFPEASGCSRWGICEPPARDAVGERPPAHRTGPRA